MRLGQLNSGSNLSLTVAAVLFAVTPYIARIRDSRVCTWMSLVAAIITIAVLAKGYSSRVSALVHAGLFILGSAWAAYGIWLKSSHHLPLRAGGIDPFAGPLGVLAVCTFLLGIGVYIVGLRLIGGRDEPFMQRFAKQRAFWIIGTALLFTSTHFFSLLEGV